MEKRFYNMMQSILSDSRHCYNSGFFNIELIEIFISGVYKGEHMYGNSLEDDSLKYFRFQFNNFVNNYFQVTTTQGWSQIIRFYSYSDSETVSLFYKLFQQFYENYPKTYDFFGRSEIDSNLNNESTRPDYSSTDTGFLSSTNSRQDSNPATSSC